MFINHAKFKELRKRLSKVVKETEDSVRFYPLSQHTLNQVEIMGVGSPVIPPPNSTII
jgi:CRISPR-associated protein Cas2